MSFVVRNPSTTTEVSIDDLGQRILPSEEFDLNTPGLFLLEELAQSADLQALIAANTLEKLTGLGGSVVPAGEAFNNNVVAHSNSHGPGGADPLDVTGCPGVLADPQTPAAHHHVIADVTDFDTEVSNNSDVSSNTGHRNTTGNPHSASTSDIPEGSNLYYTDTRVNLNANVAANTIHRNATGNPHGTTPGDIGAAAAAHTHTKSEITDFTESDYVHTTGNETVAGDKSFTGRVNVGGTNPTSASYRLSVQSPNTTSYIQIINSLTAASEGAYVGLSGNALQLFNTQGDDLDVWTGTTPAQRARFNAAGLRLFSLAGSGTRIIAVDSTGQITQGVDTDDLPEGSGNLYHTDARVSANADVAANTVHRNATGNPHGADSGDIPEGTNLYYTEARVNANANVAANTAHRNATGNPHGADTDDIGEGSSNLYYTEGRVSANTDVAANTAHRNATGNPHGTTPGDIGAIPASEKGAINGVPTLDATGRIPSSQMPTSVQEYKGAWNANTNTPTLASGVGTNGDTYRVSVAGNTNLDGETDWEVGDALIFNGNSNVWEKFDNSSAGAGPATTDDLPEGLSNLYYTEARVSANADVTANSAHRNATGNPHGADTDDIGEGSSNLYYTEARVDANANVAANTAHRNATGNPHGADTDDISEGSSNLYYTEGRVSANADVAANTVHRNATGNPHGADTDDIGEGSSNLYYTEGRVSANADVTANTAHRNATGNPHGAITDNIPEGPSNLYFTNARVDANPTVVANAAHASATGNPHGADTDDIPEGGSNLYHTTARVEAVALKRSGNDFTTFTQKTDLVGADVILIEDSEAGNVKKRATVNDLFDLTDPVEWFSGYDGAGGTSFTTTWTDVPIDNEHVKDAAFTHTGSAPDVTVDETFTYLIAASASINGGSSSRTSGEQRLMRSTNGGASYAEIPGTRRFTYHRTTNQGEDSAARFLAIPLNAGDRIKLQVRRLSGGAPLSLIANGSSLTLGKLKGVRGEQGPPGAGSTVFVAQNGTPVAGPYSTINLVGDAVTSVADAGSGQVDVTVQPFPSSEPPYGESETLSSTSSTTFVEKLSLSAVGLAAGRWEVWWYAEFRSNANGVEAEVQFEQDNATVHGEASTRDTGFFATAGSGWAVFHGRRRLTLSGNVDFDIDFRSLGGGSVQIRRARIGMTRVS